jgi:hypothetical protein
VRCNAGFLTCYDLRRPEVLAGEVAVLELRAEAKRIIAGRKTTLTWSTCSATHVRIEPGIGTVDPKGSRQIQPEKTTTYTLHAEGRGQPRSRKLTVQVLPLHPPVSAGGAVPGLQATFYPADGKGTGMPDFTKLDPFEKRVLPQLYFPGPTDPRKVKDKEDPGFAGTGKREVAMVVKGLVVIPKDGIYRIVLESPSASAVFVGEQRIQRDGALALRAGAHAMTFQYNRHVSDRSGVRLVWTTPDCVFWEPIPAAHLKHRP